MAVAWDQLEAGKIYRLMDSMALWPWRHRYDALGPMIFSSWRVFRVEEVDRSEPGPPWYRVLVVHWGERVRDGTGGWVDASEFKEHGVAHMR